MRLLPAAASTFFRAFDLDLTPVSRPEQGRGLVWKINLN